MTVLILEAPWLTMPLGTAHRVLSWSITAPGFVTADRIVWREVRNRDLPTSLDVVRWFKDEMAARGDDGQVGLLTSRDIRAYHEATANIDGVTARAVATIGLSNGERVGTRMDRSGKDWGTINVAVQVSAGLMDAALIETLSIAAQARTAAVIELGHALPTGITTGTGTDCIAVAAPAGSEIYAGLHTSIGHAVGKAVYDAVLAGGQEWMATVRREGDI